MPRRQDRASGSVKGIRVRAAAKKAIKCSPERHLRALLSAHVTDTLCRIRLPDPLTRYLPPRAFINKKSPTNPEAPRCVEQRGQRPGLWVPSPNSRRMKACKSGTSSCRPSACAPFVWARVFQGRCPWLCSCAPSGRPCQDGGHRRSETTEAVWNQVSESGMRP